jgi:hypothetical protein
MNPEIGLDWCGVFSCFLGLNLVCMLVLWPISWLLGQNQATGRSPGPVHEPNWKAIRSPVLLGCSILVLVPTGWVLGYLGGAALQFYGSRGLYRAEEVAAGGALVGFLFSFFLTTFLDPTPTPTELTEEGSLPSPGPRWSERQEDGSTPSQGIQAEQDDVTERPPESP